MFGHFTDSESRVFDLPDGRILFYAAGRAYYQADYSQAQRLESRLKWAHNLLTLAVVGTILTAYWIGNWWLALGTLPLVILMGLRSVLSYLAAAASPPRGGHHRRTKKHRQHPYRAALVAALAH